MSLSEEERRAWRAQAVADWNAAVSGRPPPAPDVAASPTAQRTSNSPQGSAVAQEPPPPANAKLAAEREKPTAEASVLRYPEDLGGKDSPYRHLMKITIFKQEHSKLSEVSSGANFDYRANRNTSIKVDAKDLATGALISNAPSIARAALANPGLTLLAGTFGVLADKVLNNSQVSNALKEGGTAGINFIGRALSEASTFEFSLARRATKIVGSLDLYMPDTLTMADSHDYDAISITDALGLTGIAQQVLGGSISTRAAVAEGLGALGSRFGALGDRAGQAFVQSQGYAINPMLQIIYQGSKNREFEYTFKFAPRSQKEAEAVIQIIKTLRFHAAPEFIKENTGSRYFIPPSEFEIEHWYYSPSGAFTRNDKLPRIAGCVLSSVDVNYAASGNYSTFEDGVPVEIDMRLRFTETLNLTKQDIDNGY